MTDPMEGMRPEGRASGFAPPPPTSPCCRLGAGSCSVAASSCCGSAGIAPGEEGMQQGWVISGELKTFRNYFPKHNSNVSCFYDLELPWEHFRVSELPKGI